MIAEAEAFNVPLVAVPGGPAPRRLAARVRRSIVVADHPNVTIEAVKKADREDALVVRVSEAWGTRRRVRVSTALPVTSVDARRPART